jgi:hypothetical protein
MELSVEVLAVLTVLELELEAVVIPRGRPEGKRLPL